MRIRALALVVLCMALGSTPAFAATILDLASAGNSATGTAAIGGGFQVNQIDPQSTGTGVIEPFLRIQAHGEEQGYNTSLGFPLDDKTSDNYTRVLPLSAVPVVNIGGVNYRQFLLDVNEDSGSEHEILSLNQIQIFQATADRMGESFTCSSAAGTNPLIAFGGAPVATEVFRLNGCNATLASSYEIKLNYDLNSGSGSGDMFLYVRDSNFNALIPYVILYSQFGSPSGSWGSSDGFEEWAVLNATPQLPQIPEPGSLVLLSSGLLAAAARARRRRATRGAPLS